MPRLNKTERERAKNLAIDILKGSMHIGTIVYPIITHVSRSGMSRNIKLLVINDGQIRNISAQVADVLDLKWNGDGSVTIGGCGMDMGWHLVHLLSTELGFNRSEREHAEHFGLERESNCYGLNHRNI